MHDLIERLRAKPEHERRRIALATSGTVTGLIAIMWFGAVIASGTLALENNDADTRVAEAPRYEEALGSAGASFSELFAAVGAVGSATSTEGLVIVETNASSTIAAPAAADTRTVIPF